ncbi:MAG: pseudaminic acid biosynthesis-associated methylase [uncultured bacterium]|nr:MAG: pseudaminic acid biosynthesis-associated methylase [uncultured bacterium]
MNFKTEQEKFWASKFGDEYVERNREKEYIASNTVLFSKIISRTINVNSILELGANIGLNMWALKNILPNAKLAAIEINKTAFEYLSKIDDVTAYNESILTFNVKDKYDLIFTKGVLIHINPDELDTIYQKMYDYSNKYILCCEYYNPTPASIPYRGHNDKLFKRDFAGELLEKFKDLKLIDYGFIYRRDNNFKDDDLTWFLLEKN